MKEFDEIYKENKDPNQEVENSKNILEKDNDENFQFDEKTVNLEEDNNPDFILIDKEEKSEKKVPDEVTEEAMSSNVVEETAINETSEETPPDETTSNETSPLITNITNLNKEARTISKHPRRKSNFKTYVALVLISTLVSGTLVGGGLYYGFSKQLSKQTALIESISSLATIKNPETASSSQLVQANYVGQYTVSQIAQKVGPSIVGIRMMVSNSQRSFFSTDNASNAEGSGIIISADGYIMTNYHVVQYADPKLSSSSRATLEVFLADGTQAKAKFVGGDIETDLAVIKIELKNLPVATLGDSSKLQVGELAVAIGNPLGLEFAGSVTTGVISALNRTLQSEDISQNLIQTDAAINPGNSGGALLNSKGEVIGINSAKISMEGVEGLGFAIPINDAKPIINQLIMFGYIKGRPLIGISGEEINSTLARAYNLPVGIYVTTVGEATGAEKAGLQEGDVITAVNGKNVSTMNELNTIKKQYKPGDTVTLTVVRGGKTLNLKLTFTEQQ